MFRKQAKCSVVGVFQQNGLQLSKEQLTLFAEFLGF